MDDDEQDIEQVMALIAEEMATRQAVARIAHDAYPTAVNVMAELSHRVALSVNEDSQ